MNCKVIYLQTIDSTNNFIKENLPAFSSEEITTVWAESQTAGRGTRGKAWQSPPGCNLYVSFLLPLGKSQAPFQSLPLLLAVILCKLLRSKEVNAQVKWPNDLLLNGKKLAGILCELCPDKRGQFAVLGLGLNINADRALLDQVEPPAASLLDATGEAWDRKALLGEISEELAKALPLFLEQGFLPFYDDFCQLVDVIGKSISHPSGTGICTQVCEDGSLIVLDENQREQRIFSLA